MAKFYLAVQRLRSGGGVGKKIRGRIPSALPRDEKIGEADTEGRLGQKESQAKRERAAEQERKKGKTKSAEKITRYIGVAKGKASRSALDEAQEDLSSRRFSLHAHARKPEYAGALG